jgi:hypothetical protein
LEQSQNYLFFFTRYNNFSAVRSSRYAEFEFARKGVERYAEAENDIFN